MPKRVKSDETASRTMSIMPTAAFICPEMRRRKRSFRREPSSVARTRRARQRARGTQPFQMRRFQQDCTPKTYLCTSSGRKDAEIAHINRWAKKRRTLTRQKRYHITSSSLYSFPFTHLSSLYNSCSFDLPITWF